MEEVFFFLFEKIFLGYLDPPHPSLDLCLIGSMYFDVINMNITSERNNPTDYNHYNHICCNVVML